jgi:hypothetical protein
LATDPEARDRFPALPEKIKWDNLKKKCMATERKNQMEMRNEKKCGRSKKADNEMR